MKIRFYLFGITLLLGSCDAAYESKGYVFFEGSTDPRNGAIVKAGLEYADSTVWRTEAISNDSGYYEIFFLDKGLIGGKKSRFVLEISQTDGASLTDNDPGIETFHLYPKSKKIYPNYKHTLLDTIHL